MSLFGKKVSTYVPFTNGAANYGVPVGTPQSISPGGVHQASSRGGPQGVFKERPYYYSAHDEIFCAVGCLKCLRMHPSHIELKDVEQHLQCFLLPVINYHQVGMKQSCTLMQCTVQGTERCSESGKRRKLMINQKMNRPWAALSLSSIKDQRLKLHVHNIGCTMFFNNKK